MKKSRSNINFDFIDYEISEKELERIKSNIAQGCIRRVDQVSANKWHYIIKAEDKIIELEVSYNKSNIKQFHCACGARSPGKICKHVLLISYWHQSVIRSRKSPNEDKPSNIASQLNNSTESDLRYYLNFLSKQNKFNYEWLRFFDGCRLISDDPFQKYSGLLIEFSDFVKRETRNPASALKIKLQILEELYYIAILHYNQSNTEESAYAVLAAINSLHEWNGQLEWKNQSRLHQINEKLHGALEQFIIGLLAPRVLNKLFKQVQTLLLNKHYLILNKKSNLFHICRTRFKNSGNNLIYFNSIWQRLQGNIQEDYKFEFLDYLHSENGERLLTEIQNTDISNLNYLLLSWLDSRKNILPVIIKFKLYTILYEHGTLELKTNIALRIAELYPGNESILDGSQLIRYYLELNNTIPLKVYFKNLQWSNSDYNKLLSMLESQTTNIQLNIQQKIDLAFYSKQWPVLLALLYEAADLNKLMQYDIDIPEEFHPELLETYIVNTKNYLDNHAGQKSHTRFLQIARHIKSLYRNRLYQTFIQKIKQYFPDRKLITQS